MQTANTTELKSSQQVFFAVVLTSASAGHSVPAGKSEVKTYTSGTGLETIFNKVI